MLADLVIASYMVLYMKGNYATDLKRYVESVDSRIRIASDIVLCPRTLLAQDLCCGC